MSDLQEREILRARWRRAGSALRLVDVSDKDFCLGGLGHHVRELAGRLVLIPFDPEADVVDFSEDVWEWWAQERSYPGLGQRRFSSRKPFAGAAVLTDTHELPCKEYTALLRSGGIDSAWKSVAWKTDKSLVFDLVRIVGHVWESLLLGGEAASRFQLTGPFQVVLGLRGTQDSVLGGFASGWERRSPFVEDWSTCRDQGVLIQLELEELPRGDEETWAVASRIGGRVEDAWGSTARRFIALSGPHKGRFDPVHFR